MRTAFAKNPDDIGRTKVVKHTIDTGDNKPVHQRCRRFCKSHIQVIRDHVDKLSANGTIRPSNSNWAANPVVVDKKSGEKEVMYRLSRIERGNYEPRLVHVATY